MSLNPAQGATTSATAQPDIDPAQLQFAMQKIRSEQNLPLGALAGLGAAALGGAAWAGITVTSGWQIGWMAVGVGFLVGLAIRHAGKGIDPPFGVLGAVFSLVGCSLGNLLTVCVLLGRQEGMGLLEVLARIKIAAIPQLMAATFSPMDVLFYGIAIFEGYRLSIRRFTPGEIAAFGDGNPLTRS